MASKRKTMVQTMESNPRKCESSPLCWGIEIHKQYRCGSKPIIDNFSGMNIHVSVILEFTRYQAFDPDWSKVVQSDWRRKYRGMCQQAAWKFLVDCGPGGYNPPRFHGSWLMSPFFTSPNHEWYMVNAMAIRWCPIFPNWDSTNPCVFWRWSHFITIKMMEIPRQKGRILGFEHCSFVYDIRHIAKMQILCGWYLGLGWIRHIRVDWYSNASWLYLLQIPLLLLVTH